MSRFPVKLLAAALAGVGVFGGSTVSTAVGTSDRTIDAALLLGISDPGCVTGAGPAAKLRPRALLAQVTNELKPLGQLPRAEEEPAGIANPQPLWVDLGPVSYPITTASPLAQQYFNQGLRLTFAFNHDEAARAYRMAQRLDPACAMCHWGEALVLGPNINLPMEAKAVAPAHAAVTKAASLMPNASPREQALIAALRSRYSAEPPADRSALDAAYADAMGKVAALHPDDQTVAVLYAESLMDLSPWDYWEAGGARPKGKTAELVATLERVLKANPDHPGAIHYYIHTVEASSDPKRAEPYAERLGRLVPGAGHLVHMPSHIYYRVGRYKESLAANKQAVDVDEAYIASQKPAGIYPLGYYPHNVHFMLVSGRMAGDGKTTIEAANKLAALVSDDTARAYAIAQPVKAAPYFAHAQFSRPETVLAIPAPGAGLPYVQGLWHYARGTAYAAQGDTSAARREANAIDRLRATGDFTALTAGGIPAQDVLRIAALVLAGRISQAAGDPARAAANFEQAAAIEDGLAYMEPPYWYYPIRQSLGAALLQKGDLDGAEQAFRASLVRAPNNGWSLYGLAEVYRKRGDAKRAAAAEELLGKAWAGRREDLAVSKL